MKPPHFKTSAIDEALYSTCQANLQLHFDGEIQRERACVCVCVCGSEPRPGWVTLQIKCIKNIKNEKKKVFIM